MEITQVLLNSTYTYHKMKINSTRNLKALFMNSEHVGFFNNIEMQILHQKTLFPPYVILTKFFYPLNFILK